MIGNDDHSRPTWFSARSFLVRALIVLTGIVIFKLYQNNWQLSDREWTIIILLGAGLVTAFFAIAVVSKGAQWIKGRTDG